MTIRLHIIVDVDPQIPNSDPNYPDADLDQLGQDDEEEILARIASHCLNLPVITLADGYVCHLTGVSCTVTTDIGSTTIGGPAVSDQHTCDWPITAWTGTGPRRCGMRAKYRVTSSPFPSGDLHFVCGIHNRTLTRDRGASEAIGDGTSTPDRHPYTVDTVPVGAEPYPCVVCGQGREAHPSSSDK